MLLFPWVPSCYVVQANTDITQVAMVMPDQSSKWVWLLNNLVQFISSRYHIMSDVLLW